MPIQTVHRFTCDDCGATRDMSTESCQVAICHMSKQGWRIRQSGHECVLCPECDRKMYDPRGDDLTADDMSYYARLDMLLPDLLGK